MKKSILIILTFISLSFIMVPSLVSADGFVPNCGKVSEVTGTEGAKIGVIDNPCDFDDLMTLINNVITFVLFYLATPLAAIIFAYAGFLYISSGGSSENVGKAKKMIKNVLIGYLIALAAWLIVKTIMVSLGFTDAGNFLNIK